MAQSAAEGASEAVTQSGVTFVFVLLVVGVCAGFAAVLIHFQRKRHQQFDLLDGSDNQYEEWHEKLQAQADSYEEVLETKPTAREKRCALLKRAMIIIPIVRFIQAELRRKDALYREGKLRPEDYAPVQELKQHLEDAMAELKAQAEEVNPGFGEKIFAFVQQFQPCQLLQVVDRNVENYNKAKEATDSAAGRKLALAMYRGMPVFNYLKQVSQQAKAIEQLREQGKMSDAEDEFETFMCIKARLEDERRAVEAEADAIQQGFGGTIFRMVMGHAELLGRAMHAEASARDYENMIEKNDFTNREKVLALMIRRFDPVWQFNQAVSTRLEEAEALYSEGKIPQEAYDTVAAVRDRNEKMLADTRAEANVLLKGLGDRLERVWETHRGRFTEVKELNQRAQTYIEESKEKDSDKKLTSLQSKRARPAVELYRKLKVDIEKAEETNEFDEVDLEVLYVFLDHVQKELQDVREEAEELGGSPDMIDEMERNLEEQAKKVALQKAKERSAATQKERLQAKLQERKPSRSASGNEMDAEAERIAREKEAERMAAELLAEVEATSSSGGTGRKKNGRKKSGSGGAGST